MQRLIRAPELTAFLWLVIAALGAPLAASAATAPRSGASEPMQDGAEISREHREWLDVVAYIIERDERRMFESLSTEWQRDRFIEAFWQRRDPLPVTPENEFRIEHMERWRYANDVLGRDTPRPGWRTDRGRVHIVNGAPFKVHPYPNTQQLWPLEVWEYRDTGRRGMPGFYQIIFFKPRVFSEWRLYSPAVDGPEALVITTPGAMDFMDRQQLATKFPIVFTAAQEVAPGLGTLGSETVIARTLSPPPPPRPLAMSFTPSGEVDAAFLAEGPIEFDLQATGFVHDELEGYVDIAVEIPAEEALYVELEDEYVLNYSLELEIETPDAGIWRDTSGGVLLRVPRAEFDLASTLPVLYRQRVWLLPGSYRVRALLREVATNQIGAAETLATVPPAADLVVGPPHLFYATEDRDAAGVRGDWRVFIPWLGSELQTGSPVGCLVRVLSTTEDPTTDTEPSLPLAGLEIEYRVMDGPRLAWSDTWSGDPPPRHDNDSWTVARSLHIEELPAGSYELEVWAREPAGDGVSSAAPRRIGARSFELVDEFLPVARLLTGRARADDAQAHHQLGQQFLRRDEFARARQHFEAAVRLDPRNTAFQVDAAKTLVLAGEFTTAGVLLEQATRRDPGNQEAWATLGLLKLQQQDFAAAIEAYQRGLQAAPGTPALYNGLAEAYLSTNDVTRAIEMLERSLEINPDQEQVRRLHEQLRSGAIRQWGER